MLLTACLVTGCAGLTPSADAPPSAVLPCARPVLIPDPPLSDQLVETLWRRDRLALLECGGQVEVLAGRPIPTQ